MAVSILIPDLELFIIYTMMTSVFWGVIFFYLIFLTKTEEFLIFGQVSPLAVLIRSCFLDGLCCVGV